MLTRQELQLSRKGSVDMAQSENLAQFENLGELVAQL